MAEVFINYRTGDGEWPAAFLDDKFKRRYGRDRVFRDATSLDAGLDFRGELRRRLRRCTVLVAIIGPNWLTAGSIDGERLIDDPDDYVRMEIESCLRRKIRVVPVTLNATPLPHEDDLPPAIADLASYQKREFRSRNYQSDFDDLVAVIDEEIPLATDDRDAEKPQRAGDGIHVGSAKRSAIGHNPIYREGS
jgi:hypothetical protein